MKKDWQHNNPESEKYISYKCFSQEYYYKDNRYDLENLPPLGTIISNRRLGNEYEWYYTDKNGKEHLVNNSKFYFKPYYEPDYEVISNEEVYYKPMQKVLKIKDFTEVSYIVGFEVNDKNKLIIKTALDVDNELTNKNNRYKEFKEEFKDWDN